MQCFEGEKGDIQNRSFLPFLSYMLLLVLTLDVAKTCSYPILASFKVSLGPGHPREEQQQGVLLFSPLARLRLCRRANILALSAPICAGICMSFLSPLAGALQQWAPEHVLYKKLSLLHLFSMEAVFFRRSELNFPQRLLL